ncbi:endonuclease MutS2 [Cytophagaceae bacterium ABcell3]|nr:endonuclease MutS2 [Cytophagaceae bacterium ABcell3]
MLFPDSVEQKLGFDQIRQRLETYCLSKPGRAFVSKIKFSGDHKYLQVLLRQTAEFLTILKQDISFPVSGFLDIYPCLEKIRPEGTFPEGQQFLDILSLLKTLDAIHKFLDYSEEEEYPHLKNLAKDVFVDRVVAKQIAQVLDDRGEVRDNASPELLQVRRELLSEKSRIRKETDRMLRLIKKEGYSAEDVSATIRNGRMVIPVAAEYKRKVKGFIHDESASGQTVFIEPAEVLEINNNIKSLEYRERREVIRLLIALSDSVRPYLPQLRKAAFFIGVIDFIRAKALLSIELSAVVPSVHKNPMMKWNNARHPLLELALHAQGRKIVPLNFDLNADERILVISGPNAGGKSVSLKTVGLLQYMLQCGLPVPMDESSEMGIFQDIFIDIGDEQSIENDLSTYSSHLSNMKFFLKMGAKKSLVLIDEFGTGTEPQMGGAIAEAILEQLNQLGVWGVITTHYTNLKLLAGTLPGFVNGSMRYDLKRLEPLYELEIGRPGSSYALEIAQKTGLPHQVIAVAREKAGKSQVDFDRMIRDMEKEKHKLVETSRRIREKERKLEKDLKEYTSLKEDLDKNKKEYINKAKAEAKELLKDANRRIEETIRNIKESKAEKETTKKLRDNLRQYSDKSLKTEVEQEYNAPDYEVEEGEIAEGDYVRVKESGAVGKVTALKGKNAELAIGELKSNVKVQRLEKISRKKYREHHAEKKESSATLSGLNKKMMAFTPDIDVRGRRGEEALAEVDGLLDSAIMFGAKDLRIVHGKGDGILRTLIRERLRTYPQVVSIDDEHADRGGAGVTLVKMRA